MLLRAFLQAETRIWLWPKGQKGLALRKKAAFATICNNNVAQLHVGACTVAAKRPGIVDKNAFARIFAGYRGQRGFSLSSTAKTHSFGRRGKIMLLLGGLGGMGLAYALHKEKDNVAHKRPRILDPPHGFSDDFRHPYKVRPGMNDKCVVINAYILTD